MRTEVLHYLEDVIRLIQLPTPIVDFGGVLVDGQDIQFKGAVQSIVGSDYKTFDLDPKADICGDIHNTGLESDSIGTALMLEVLEHLAYPQTAITEMFRVLKPSGIIVITTLMCWGEHRCPADYWRFLPDGILHLMHSVGFTVLGLTTEGSASEPSGIFAYGRKN